MTDTLTKKFNTPNPNILANTTQFVKDELIKGGIPMDAKLALIGTVDNNGTRIAVAVKIANTDKLNVSVLSAFEHEHDGDNTFGTSLVLYVK